jgi:serine/threonine protein kinase
MALDELAGDVEFERVFVDEARIASSIVHPNVCTIYEMGAERAIPYLVMEWIDGGSLHDILVASEGRRIDYFVAARIIASVCSGLHAAHELTDLDGAPMHVVHRDVSPQNILISEHGHVKIVDFGVARAKGQLHKPTETGELKGKLSYMAPEQLTSKHFDRRADLFALGCVLFQATVGQRPFHGNDALETMYKLLETECERPRTLCPDYPEELEAIVLKALSKNVETRYQTADEFERDLERFLTTQGKLITDRDITGLVAHTLGPFVRRRAEDLRNALEAADHPNRTVRPGANFESSTPKTPTGLSLTSSTFSRPEHTVSSERTSEQSASTRGAWESIKPQPPSSRPFPLNRVWLTVSVGVLLLAFGGWFSFRGAQTKLGSTTSHAAYERPAATSITPVEIRIRTIPPEANIQVDQGETHRGVFVLSTTPSSTVHQLTITLDGYETQQRSVVFERSMNEVIELHAVATNDSAAPNRSTTPSRRTSPLPKTVAPTNSGATIPTKPPEPGLGKNRKTKRSLDPTNPFSEP